MPEWPTTGQNESRRVVIVAAHVHSLPIRHGPHASLLHVVRLRAFWSVDLIALVPTQRHSEPTGVRRGARSGFIFTTPPSCAFVVAESLDQAC